MCSIDLKEEEMVLKKLEEYISENELSFSKWYLRMSQIMFDFTYSLHLLEEEAKKEGNEDVVDLVEEFKMWSASHPFIPQSLGVRNQRKNKRR